MHQTAVLFGGRNEFNNVTNDLSLYDEEHGWYTPSKWSEAPRARSGHGIAVSGPYMYMFGGKDENDTILNDFWQLQLITTPGNPLFQAVWRQLNLANLPPARALHGMYAVGEVIFITCGISSTGTSLKDTWVINTGTAVCKEVLSAPSARVALAAVALDCDQSSCGSSPVQIAVYGGLPFGQQFDLFTPGRAHDLLSSYLWDLFPLAVLLLAMLPFLVCVVFRRLCQKRTVRHSFAEL